MLCVYTLVISGTVNIDERGKLERKKLINPKRELNSRLLFTVGSQSKTFETFSEPNAKPSFDKHKPNMYVRILFTTLP